ncbi:DNA polymerase III subunit delta [Actinopolymorpha alba]|uniref:DNA polymerase III subunit delta n=1 Tax=Actinopolymorpha alba TaxID=533267 RepID=UPI000475D6FA|nr:DNA polymerase III subunit delta [Actinopolymorpha alba]
MATKARSAPSEGEALGGVTLVLGPEDLLVDRAVAAAVASVRASDPDADLTELEAASLAPGALAELTSPSLFASARAVVVRGLDTLPAEAADAVLSYAKDPQPDVALVLTHRGGQKGRGLLDKLRKARVRVVACEALKSYELPTFVIREARGAGGRISEEAAQLLIESVGSDLRALAGAASQLISDAGGVITEEAIRAYFAGRAEVTSFAVADAAVTGRTAHALEQLRWALRSGVAPVLVTSALASGLRGLAKLAGAPRGLRDGDLAREIGVPPWKVKTLRGQLRGWSQEGLATAIQAVARADADVKGGADDADYALERAVLAVSRARSEG